MSGTDAVADRLFERLAAVDEVYYTSAFYTLLLGYVLLVLLAARSYSADARLFPLLVGVPLAVMLVGKLFVDLAEPLEIDVAGPFADVFEGIGVYDADTDVTRAERYRREAGLLLWLVALLVSVWLLGFLLSSFVYVSAFVYYYERNPTRAFLVGGITTAFLYVLFVRVLSAPIYGGVLGSLL